MTAGHGLTAHGIPQHVQQDVLIQLPVVEVHKVEGKAESVVARGSLVVTSTSNSEQDVAKVTAQVGELVWELLPATPTLKVGELTYMFALPGGDVFYSVTLAEDTDPAAVGVFEALLEECTIYKESDMLIKDPELQKGDYLIADNVRYKSQTATRIQSGASKTAQGLLMAATLASSKLQQAGASMQKRITPAEQPTQISPATARRIRRTKDAAHTAAKVAGGIVSGLASVSAAVANTLLRAVGAQRSGHKADLPPGKKQEVAAAAALGFSQVWDAMEDGGRLVLVNARDATTGVVNHKYGAQAAQASKDSLNAVGHATDAVYSVRKIGVKTVAKATAKTTAKGLLKHWASLDTDAFKKGGSSNTQASTSAAPPASAQSSSAHAPQYQQPGQASMAAPAPLYKPTNAAVPY